MIRLNFLTCIMLGLFLATAAPLTGAEIYQGTVTLSPEKMQIDTIAGFDVIDFNDCDYTDIVGAPRLPVFQVNVALPTGAVPFGVHVLGMDSMEISGDYEIVPATQPIPISSTAPEDPFIQDPAYYDVNENFPGTYAELISTWDLAGQEFATLKIYPVQHNPIQGKVTLVTRIDFELEYDMNPAAERKTYNYSEKTRNYWQKKLKNMALNPEGVTPFPQFTPKTLAGVTPGDYEYVIITPTTFESAFQPLADWRTQMGMPANIVTTTWIYVNYSGASNQERIRNFVIDANTNWGTQFFLLGGDVAYVPYHIKTIDGDNIPNDTYYADFDDDRKYEVFVGRAPVNNTTQVNTFINKVFTYEKNPPSSYGSKVFFMGFNLDSSTKGENCKIKIKDEILPAYATLVTEYDSEAYGHETDVKNYINAGQNLINHIDHSDTTLIGVGLNNHGTRLNTTEAANFTNGTKYGNMKTLGCYCGNYPSTCWGEAFVRDDQGGISFTGNSRYGWYSPGNINSLSFKYDQKWWNSLYLNNAYHVGETLADALNSFYPYSTTFHYIFQELNVLGDPGLHLWTKEPVNMTVAHDAAAFTGFQDFTVNVKYIATPIENALVCLMKGTDVYAYATTDAAGNAAISIDPATAGSMTVTVTAQNYKYYEGAVNISVGSFAPALDAITPKCGKEAGGSAVTLTGSHFTTSPAMTVTIGGTACSAVSVVNSTTITCNTPAGVNGYETVAVSNTNGSDSLVGGFRYFPVTNMPFNGTDVPTNALNTPAETTLIASGNPGALFLVYFSAGAGPLPTPFGNAGLDNPIIYLFAASLNAEGYLLLPVSLPSGFGPVDLYVHLLGADNLGKPAWSFGGNNPNGTGSVLYHLNN